MQEGKRTHEYTKTDAHFNQNIWIIPDFNIRDVTPHFIRCFYQGKTSCIFSGWKPFRSEIPSCNFLMIINPNNSLKVIYGNCVLKGSKGSKVHRWGCFPRQKLYSTYFQIIIRSFINSFS